MKQILFGHGFSVFNFTNHVQHKVRSDQYLHRILKDAERAFHIETPVVVMPWNTGEIYETPRIGSVPHQIPEPVT